MGLFSPRNPRSPYYGLIGRNTPIRVTTVGGTPSLRLDGTTGVYASTPDTAALHITGNLDVRAEITANWWSTGQNAIMGRWEAGDHSWALWARAGTVGFTFADSTGSSWFASGAIPADMPERAAVRATLAVDNLAGGWTVTLSWASSIAGAWTQFRSFTSAGVVGLRAGTAPLRVSPTGLGTPIVGQVHAVEVRNGINGPIVAGTDFSALSAGATSWAGTTGLPWTATAGAIGDRSTRFVGEVSQWPLTWDVSGGDVYTSVQAAGILRRLQQGATALSSTLARRIPSYDPVAYWPMEETGGTQAYSPIAGVRPMSVVGMQWASDASLPGSLALPSVQSPCSISGAVPLWSDPTQWRVEMVMRIDTAPASYSTFINFIGSGTVTKWTIQYMTGAVQVIGRNANGDAVVTQPVGIGDDLYGTWTRQIFTATQSGSTVTWTIEWTSIGEVAGGSLSGTYTGTVGAVTGVSSAFSTGTVGARIGHVAVFPTADSSAFNSADAAFNGEDGWARVNRLCTEEGVPVAAPYGHEGTPAMGPQTADTLLNLLDAVQDADLGILGEHRDTIALAYRTRTSLYNQVPALVLDYTAAGEVAPDLTPTEDDTATRNDITVSRPDGSSARVTLDTGALSTASPPDGVGRYAETETVAVETDDQLSDIAGWLLLLGTWDEARYPTATVNLAAGPWLRAAVCGVDVGDRIQITNPPPWLPPEPIDLIAQGYTETIGAFDWTVSYNCTPAGPWSSIGVAADAGSRANTDGSVLDAAVDADDTELSVTATVGAPWIDSATFPAEFPFDIEVGGERMTVTAIDGLDSPQTFTVVRAVNGISKPQPAAAPVALARPVYVAL
jgi:hypothetical protein